MDSFSIIYGAGLALCVLNAIVLIGWMNKNLQYLDVDLGALPVLLVAFAGFALFPFVNLIVGIGGAALLIASRPNWGAASHD